MNHPLRAKSLLTLPVVLGLVSAPAVSQTATSESLLAVELSRAAHRILETEPLSVNAIDSALILAQEIVALVPDDPGSWRMLLKIATLADRSDLNGQALQKINKLDPEDEVARFLRLSTAIDQYQTFEQRQAAYEQLLGERNRPQLGSAVASQLALDAAFLHQRAGDNEAFSQWLAEACIIDPSNRESAALANDYFQAVEDDPFARAELLSTLLLTDPTDLPTQIKLARTLLEAGAYPGALRIYRLLQASLQAEELWMDNDMLADLAMVNWALGDRDEAFAQINRWHGALDSRFQRQALLDQPTLQPRELAQLHAPRDPLLATVIAAIHQRLDDELAEPSLQEVRDAYEGRISKFRQAEDDTTALQAQLLLERAWIEVWLGRESAPARQTMLAADALSPISDAARQRFEGWFTLREGDPNHAIELLEPLSEDDPAARLGLALAHLALDQQQDAARNLLQIARAQPGTLMGIWAADLLSELLGQGLTPSDLARQLNTLIRSLPTPIDRYPSQPTTALRLQIRPVHVTINPYDELLVDLEIRNFSTLSLGVGPKGPIRPQIAIFQTVNLARDNATMQMPPIVVDIDRVLRLEPGKREIIRVNLMQYGIGNLINANALGGLNVQLTGVLNFYADANGQLKPGLLGSMSSPPFIHINSVPITDDFLKQSITAVATPDGPDLKTMALLCRAIARPAPADPPTPETRTLLEEAITSVQTVYPHLDPAGQAWMLAVMPVHESFEPILNMARKSDNRLIKLAYLIFQNTGPDDPMLDAAVRGDDDAIRLIAQMITESDDDEPATPPATGDGNPPGDGG